MPLKNFDAYLLDEDDLPITETRRDSDGKEIETRKITVARVIGKALEASLDGDDKIGFSDKITRYKLAQRVRKGGVITVNQDEISIIKECARKSLSISAFGQVIDALDATVTEAAPAANAGEVKTEA